MKADWNLIYKAYCGIQWIMESNSVTDKKKTLAELYDEKIRPIWGNERLLNDGVLMMASSILLVYVLEKENRKKVDLSKIDISQFKITFSKKKHSTSEFLRRIRNSISHGKYKFDKKDKILFQDFIPSKRSTTEIRFQIDKVNFGMFLTNFAKEIDRQVNSRKSKEK